MSSLYLALALIGTFGAIVVGGVVAQTALTTRRRSVEILQSTVGEVPNLRTQQLAEPFMDRLLVPLIEGLGRVAQRVTPIGMRSASAWRRAADSGRRCQTSGAKFPGRSRKRSGGSYTSFSSALVARKPCVTSRAGATWPRSRDSSSR